MICSSEGLTYLFKLVYKWAKENFSVDFVIRLVFILTHIAWCFYLKDAYSTAAFVWMTLFNLSLSLYIYLETKVAVSAIFCSLVCWVAIWWMFSSDCIYDTCELNEAEDDENNQSERERQPIQLHNQNWRRRRR